MTSVLAIVSRSAVRESMPNGRIGRLIVWLLACPVPLLRLLPHLALEIFERCLALGI
jgi:hypothetical protein